MAEDSPSDAPPQPPPAADTQPSSEQSTSSAADKECPSPKPPSQQSDSSVMPQKEQSPTPTSQAAVTDLDLSTKTEKEEPPPPPPQAAEVVVSDGPPAFAEKEEQTTPHPIVLESEAPETPEKETAPQQPAAVVVESRSLAAMMEKEELPPQQPDVKQNLEPTAVEEVAVAAEDKTKLPQNLVSFKEESNIVADLSVLEKKALQELKDLVQEALNAHQFASPPPQQTPPVSTEPKKEAPLAESDVSTGIKPPQEPEAEEKPQKGSQEEEKQEPKVMLPPEEVSIWGIPLLKDDRTDVILLKFLRARDFKVKDAFVMIKNTIQWRKDFGIDALVEEDLGDDLEKVVFMHGHDREGHPVCYNVYGEFQNRELYLNTFSDAEKRMKFLRWRIQFLERSIRKLDFTPGGVSTIVQVNDLKNSPGPGKRELRLATKQAVHLLQDNYPEFVAKQVFINVPWWYLAFYTMIGPFMTQRTKSKFVFAGPSKSAEVLFKYISPEQVPIQYGGLSVDYCDCNPEFTNADPVTEITVKPATKQTVEIIIYEKCVIVWEVRVVGWEVSYGAEFVPDAKGGYTVIIQKPTKMAPMDEPVVSQSFKVGELGKILLTVDNPTSKKKKLLYRFKVQPFCD